jgi:hypothetical protein
MQAFFLTTSKCEQQLNSCFMQLAYSNPGEEVCSFPKWISVQPSFNASHFLPSDFQQSSNGKQHRLISPIPEILG